MTTSSATAALDRHRAEHLGAALDRCFATSEVDADAFAADAFFDLLPPFWRFQLEGPEAFAAQLRATGTGASTVRALRLVPTATGFVLEHEQRVDHGDDVVTARRLLLCEVRDGRIAEVVVYCNGDWDDDLRRRHAAEAPMVRREERP